VTDRSSRLDVGDGAASAQSGAVYSIADRFLPADKSSPLPIEWAVEMQPHLSSYWLIQNVLPQEGLALIYGHPGCGKSFLAVDIGMHVAQGRPWAGHKTQRGLVLYVAAEGQRGIRNRIVAFRQFHGLDDQTSFALVPAAVNLFDCAAGCAALSDVISRASVECGDSPALVVIDTVSKTLGSGKENTDDLAVYVANCARLATQFQCCVLAVHRRPKNAEGSDPRGHGSLLAGVDTSILIEGRETRSVQLKKQKDGEEGQLLTFCLEKVDLGVDDDGEVVRSCVVKTKPVCSQSETERSNQNVSLHGPARYALLQLLEILRRTPVPIPNEIPASLLDRSQVTNVATRAYWRDWTVSTFRTGSDTKPDSQRKAFDRAVSLLEKRGFIVRWGKWVWPTPQMGMTIPDNLGHGTRTSFLEDGQVGRGSLDPSVCPTGESGHIQDQRQ
jgi:hypothetical protein